MTDFAVSQSVAHALSANNSERRPWRSAGAVVAGLLFTFAVTTAVDLGLHALKIFPAFEVRMSDALFVLALAYRIPFNIGGSYLAARLAPRNPRRHALILGAVGTVLATLGAIAMWAHGPAWYSIANIVVALPCAWSGAKLFAR